MNKLVKERIKNLVCYALVLMMVLPFLPSKVSAAQINLGITKTVTLEELLDRTYSQSNYDSVSHEWYPDAIDLRYKYRIKKSELEDFFDRNFWNNNRIVSLIDFADNDVDIYETYHDSKKKVDLKKDDYFNFSFYLKNQDAKTISESIATEDATDSSYLIFSFENIDGIFADKNYTIAVNSKEHSIGLYLKAVKNSCGGIPYKLEDESEFGNKYAFLDSPNTKVISSKLYSGQVIENNTAVVTGLDSKELGTTSSNWITKFNILNPKNNKDNANCCSLVRIWPSGSGICDAYVLGFNDTYKYYVIDSVYTSSVLNCELNIFVADTEEELNNILDNNCKVTYLDGDTKDTIAVTTVKVGDSVIPTDTMHFYDSFASNNNEVPFTVFDKYSLDLDNTVANGNAMRVYLYDGNIKHGKELNITVKNKNNEVVSDKLSILDSETDVLVEKVSTPAEIKSLDDGNYALYLGSDYLVDTIGSKVTEDTVKNKVFDYIGNLEIENGIMTFKDTTYGTTFYTIDSVSVTNLKINLVLQKSAFTVKVIDEIDGVQNVRVDTEKDFGTAYDYKPLADDSIELTADSKTEYTGLLAQDEEFVFKYTTKAIQKNAVNVKVLDIHNNVNTSAAIKIGNITVGTDTKSENGTYDLSIDDIVIGKVSIDKDNPKVELLTSCKRYSVKSVKKVENGEIQIVLGTNAGKIKVVDKYDGSSNVRSEDLYAIGDTYSYQALDKQGYTVDKKEQTGTVKDDVTIYFTYTKVKPSEPTQPTEPTTPSTPSEPSTEPTTPSIPSTPTEPTQPTTPSEPSTEPTTPSTSSEPSTEPTTPSTPSTEPTTPSEPDTEPTKPTKIEKVKIKVYDKYDGKKHLRKELEVKKSNKEIVLKALNKTWYTAKEKTITVKSNKNQEVVFEYTKNKPVTKNKPKPEITVQEDIKSPKTYDNSGIYGVVLIILLVCMGITFVLGKKKDKED